MMSSRARPGIVLNRLVVAHQQRCTRWCSSNSDTIRRHHYCIAGTPIPSSTTTTTTTTFHKRTTSFSPQPYIASFHHRPTSPAFIVSSSRGFSSSTVSEKKKDDEETTETTNTAGSHDDEKQGFTKKKKKKKKDTSDLRESVKRMQGHDKDDEDSQQQPPQDENELLGTARGYLSAFTDEVAHTWQELVDSGKPKGINKKILPTSSQEESSTAAADYEGTKALMIIDESENMGAFEKIQRRLSEAPIIQKMLGASHDAFEQSGARHLKERLDDVKHDATEAWETSQNPWVYRISSVYDTVTAETDLAIATRELQKLDPDFTMERFKEDAVEHTLPEIMRQFLRGEISSLEPWLGEAVYQRLAAENAVRKKEGLIVDANLLGIFNAEIVAVEMDKVDKQSPIVLLHYMCQQINCVRNKDGDIVEGQEDDIRANSYLMAFQREYDEDEGALNWKIVDFRFNGAIAWI